MVNKLWKLMILFLGVSGIIGTLFCMPSLSQEPPKAPPYTGESSAHSRPFVPGEILVRPRPDSTEEQIHEMTRIQGITVLEANPDLGLYRLGLSGSIRGAIASVKSQPFVEDALPNYILAEVCGDVITLLDLESTLHGIPSAIRPFFAKPDARETLLRALVDQKLFAKAAREQNLDVHPGVKRKMDAALEKVLAEVFRQKILRGTPISEKEMRDYYETHHEKFHMSEQIKIRQILVKTEKEAREALEAIEGGRDFGEVARERSKSPTAPIGGELGWFGRGRLHPGVERVGFSLEKGEISEIIETPFGYYIIMLEDKRAARQQPFSEVKTRIEQSLQARKQQGNIEQKRKELGERYGLRLHRESLSEVKVYKAVEKNQTAPLRTLQDIFKTPSQE